MRSSPLAFVLALPLLSGCGDSHGVWREQVLPSGKTVQVTSFLLAWGSEHDERRPDQDCFALEYVSADPQADPQVREQEALEVFELIRPVSELWGLTTATIAGFPTTERKGRYDLFVFKRGPTGAWSHERVPSKVFAND